jgi:hypothetical protein
MLRWTAVWVAFWVVILLVGFGPLPGCGNVSLTGEALTAAQTSTLDAYQAVQRAAADPAVPDWEQAYLEENFKQWRCFVQSAKKDLNWGPKLASENAAPAKAGG